ncbi:glutamate--cysteine ligase [Nocardioides sp. Kera G14]|uniref:carboxylate-amine ligase n=1 Tax=Nocardioides sp. Kera G14 TaxID=2884264 RepID=UPI001D0FFEC3|nr:glutamate--cysteine ligase [Nocardioides sp. Kera G14]UDY24657.1 glutamate--cysteine ligase [Nocardioides sp. Kera G14]
MTELKKRTVGVEEEFLLVHTDSARLAPEGEEVVAAAEAHDARGQFEHELQRQQAELGSAPHSEIAVLAKDLEVRRTQLATAAAERDVRLLPAATSPLDQHVTATNDARYERMMAQFGRVGRRQLTCGMHIHVSVESPEEGVAVLDRIHGWLPVLTALSANSPFFEGLDTEYASYRTVLWGQWPSAGFTEPFGSFEAYEKARADLVATGAALDEGMIYFNTRLSARYPTLEIRVADVCADVADAPVIAALARGLVSTAAADAASGLPAPRIRTEMLRAAMWRASRWGMEGELVDALTATLVPAWEMVDLLVEAVRPALDRTDDTQLVIDGLARIRERGTGARVQRDAHAKGGFGAVVDALAIPPRS